jgi:hypothetical protein
MYEIFHLTKTPLSGVLGGWVGWANVHKNVSLRQGFCCGISGSHSGAAEDSSLRGCDTGLLGD